MPRRAIFSLLIALVGALPASAASLSHLSKHRELQPRRTVSPLVLSPGQGNVIRPATSGRWRPVILQPATQALRPARWGRQP